MGKVRVYELAKNMGLENKELLVKLADAGIEVSSHSSSLADEDVQKLNDFINPPKQKIEEAVIKPGIIRRRRKVVREPVPEPPEVVEAPVTEAPAIEEDSHEPVVASTMEEGETLPTDAAQGEEIEDSAPAAVDVSSQEVVTVQPEKEENQKSEKVAEEKSPESSQDSIEKPQKVKKPVVEKVTGDRAKILGRVELPKAALGGQRKPRTGERPVRQDRKPGPGTRPAHRPAAAPSRANKRVDPAPLAPMEQPLPEKEGRNKKRNKDGVEMVLKLGMDGFPVVAGGLKCLNQAGLDRKRNGVEGRISQVNKLR